MIYHEITTVSAALASLPESCRKRFSNAGWEAWWNEVSSIYKFMDVRLDVAMVQDYYEYDTAVEAVEDLSATGTVDTLREVCTKGEADLSLEEMCWELITAPSGYGFGVSLAYTVQSVAKTRTGSILVKSV